MPIFAQSINIPIEILRTFAVAYELGSFSKAAERLGLSQPAVSAHNKRLQIIVGGPVFERITGGVTLTERGELLVPQVRRLLDANDQILNLGGASIDRRPFRIGLNEFFVERFLQRYDQKLHGSVSVTCDTCTELEKGLADGYLDIACLIGSRPEAIETIECWPERFGWVRSRDLVVSPGSPIPLISWPASTIDRLAIRALETAGIAYRLAFCSADWRSRHAAAMARRGYLASHLNDVREPLIRAGEYFLPPFPPVNAGIGLRPGIDRKAVAHLIALLKSIGIDDSVVEVKPGHTNSDLDRSINFDDPSRI